MRFLIILGLFFYLTIANTFAVDVVVETNTKGCIGLVSKLINGQTEYVTFKNLNQPLPQNIAGKVYPNTKIDSKGIKRNTDFFLSLKRVLVQEKNSSSPLKKLKENQLYTFVFTDKEIRFATTIREQGAKNLASKHALLANITDQVHFAGEAWLEKGVLVINNNSGTFRPEAQYLENVAEYFQKALGVKKVNFVEAKFEEGNSSNAEVIAKETSRFQKLKAYVKSKITSFEEGLISLIAKNDYQGKRIGLNLIGKAGDDFVFEVGEFVGSGFFGAVYKIKVIKTSSQFIKANSEIIKYLESGELIVKFPNKVPILDRLPLINIFEKSIMSEANSTTKFKGIEKILSGDQNILFVGLSPGPFLIKKFLKAQSIQSLAENFSELSEQQVISLKHDVFNKAQEIFEKYNADLDIKAENIAWDETNNRFVFFEVGFKLNPNGFYIKDGFKGYFDYFKQRIEHYRFSRKPSSMIEIPLCYSSSIVPDKFGRSFRSFTLGGELDLNLGVLRLNSNERFKCFRIESSSFDQNSVRLNLKILSSQNDANFIGYQIIFNKEQSSFSEFMKIFINNNLSGLSLEANLN